MKNNLKEDYVDLYEDESVTSRMMMLVHSNSGELQEVIHIPPLAEEPSLTYAQRCARGLLEFFLVNIVIAAIIFCLIALDD